MTTHTQRLRHHLNIPHEYRTASAIIALWVLAMISVPIVRWIIGEAAIHYGIIITVMLQASAVGTLLIRQWGLRRTVITLSLVAIMTWSAEAIGSHTGFPFGGYSYTDLLQPQIAHVPLMIPLAWFMMIPSAWAIAQVFSIFFRSGIQRKLAFIVFSSFALTAWDLFLDPQMVQWGFWVWHNPEGYFGIPWVNYVGWLLVASSVTLIANPPQLEVRPFLLIYGIVWILQSIGQAFFWNQPGPAFVGFIAMGGILLLAILAHRRQTAQ